VVHTCYFLIYDLKSFVLSLLSAQIQNFQGAIATNERNLGFIGLVASASACGEVLTITAVRPDVIQRRIMLVCRLSVIFVVLIMRI
jgi:hypothetical protein